MPLRSWFVDDPKSFLDFTTTENFLGFEAHLPFGGVKASGNGTRESGIWVLDAYTRWHAVNVDLADQLQLAQMDVDYGQANEPISFKDWVND